MTFALDLSAFAKKTDARMEAVCVGIYCIRNMLDGKMYVGSSVNCGKRFAKHRAGLNTGQHHSSKLQRAWNKYGKEAFEFFVIEVVEDVENLLAKEQVWLDKLDTAKGGYNICCTAGSNLGKKCSQATKDRIALVRTGKKHLPESIEKMRAASTGRECSPATRAKLSVVGKSRSPEAEKRRALSQVGRKRSEETRLKMSIAQKGKKHSDETRSKLSAIVSASMTPQRRAEISASLMGRKNGPHTEESIAKMSAAKMGHVVSAETRAKISAAFALRRAA